VLPELNEKEVRVIGCLIEKSVVTPDQYPLTLNALTNACNQKSSRSPVMNLTQGEVQHTIRDLEAKHLVRTDENFKSRTEKYTQRFCNTRYSDFHFDDAQLAIVCLLLLRGPQTPGELRSRSGRLHTFADNSGVVSALTSLIERDGEPLLVKLPRSCRAAFAGPHQRHGSCRTCQQARSGARIHQATARYRGRLIRREAQHATYRLSLPPQSSCAGL
jgi:uncharacterized protein YceH (UPF0502 family)